MSWAEQKVALKQKVHDTFALPAHYVRAVGSAGVAEFDITARLNNDVRVAGGVSQLGFSQIIQDVPKLRLDSDAMALQGGGPNTDDVIEITSERLSYRVISVLPMDNKFYVVEVEVVRE